jgi:hypothetical protein
MAEKQEQDQKGWRKMQYFDEIQYIQTVTNSESLYSAPNPQLVA